MPQTTPLAVRQLSINIADATSNGMLKRTSSHKYLFLITYCFAYYSFFILFKCLKHVVNLANIAVMGHITKVAVIENTNTIWKYDPGLPDNHVLRGSLDVVEHSSSRYVH
jgi:hypothetical protein